MSISDLLGAGSAGSLILLAGGVLAAVNGLVILARVMRRLRPVQFAARPLLNKSEARVFAVLEPLVRRHFGPGVRLMAQVTMGEFLTSKDRAAFLSINPRRVDFLIVDSGFRPLCAVEYQGSGHYGSTKAQADRARDGDRTKRRALQAAGVPLIEIEAQIDPQKIDAQLGQITGFQRQQAA